MTKLPNKKLALEHTQKLLDQLYRALTLAESKPEVALLLKDLLTRTELQMISKRLETARLLKEGESYEVIKKRLNTSDVTIANVNNRMESFGKGYRLILSRIHPRMKNKSYIPRSDILDSINFWKESSNYVHRKIRSAKKRRSGKK